MPSYAIQRVGDDYEHTEPKGEVDADGFKAVIDTFPWKEQHEQWDIEQQGPLPAVVLRDEPAQRELWVTAMSEDTSGEFQIHAVSVRKRKTIFGKEKIEQDVQTTDVHTRIELDALIDLVFQQRYDAMDQAIARLARRSGTYDD